MRKSNSAPIPPKAPATTPSRKPDADEKRPGVKDPRFTTQHGITSPKFGSAGGGGAEDDPGPDAG
jgi:hypothetical protein